MEIEFEAQLPFGEYHDVVSQGRFDFALINQRSDREAIPEFRQMAAVKGGVYGHIDFARGRQLPLEAECINQLPFILPSLKSLQEQEVMANYRAWGIFPEKIAGQTQYYDVIAAMLERGLGVASFSEALLSAAARERVVLLYPMQSWRLLWYRKRDDKPGADEIEAFLLQSVLDDPDYPNLTSGSEGIEGPGPVIPNAPLAK